MIRCHLFGKVAYLRNEQEVFDFALRQFNRVNWDEAMKDYMPSVEDVKRDFLLLRSLNSDRLIKGDFLFRQNTGVALANYFMNFRFGLAADGRISIEEVLKRRPDRLRVVVHKIVTLRREKNIALNDFIAIAKIAGGGQGLGNFMPAVAKALYEQYVPEKGRILDISAGFGGRLTGAMASRNDYSYVGVDPSIKAIAAGNALISLLNASERARLINLPFEDSEPELGANESYDFCFTSPPYFAKERYSDEPTQSFHRYPGFQPWVEGFLKPTFEIVMRKLKPGKIMAINIADVRVKGKIYPLEQATIDTAKSIGFEHIGTKTMEMSKMPGLKGVKFKSEPVFLFRKNQ